MCIHLYPPTKMAAISRSTTTYARCTTHTFMSRVYSAELCNFICKMASACRSASLRTIASHSNLISRTLKPKCVPISPFSSSTRAIPRAASRIVGALGIVESMMPLHTAIASARLKSSLAVNSTCWSWLSQGLGTSL